MWRPRLYSFAFFVIHNTVKIPRQLHSLLICLWIIYYSKIYSSVVNYSLSFGWKKTILVGKVSYRFMIFQKLSEIILNAFIYWGYTYVTIACEIKNREFSGINVWSQGKFWDCNIIIHEAALRELICKGDTKLYNFSGLSSTNYNNL